MVTGKTVAMAADGSVVLMLGMEEGAMAGMVAATAAEDWVGLVGMGTVAVKALGGSVEVWAVLAMLGMVEEAGAGMGVVTA